MFSARMAAKKMRMAVTAAMDFPRFVATSAGLADQARAR
jgi:hypothetical protein